jgi:hypothetical protein
MGNEVGIFFSMAFFLIGASYLASPKEWALFFQSLAEKPYAGIPLALYSIPAGMVILSFHNNWQIGFPLFITVAGWSLALKGVVLMLFPGLPKKYLPKAKALQRWLIVCGALLMVLSALSGLSYYI